MLLRLAAKASIPRNKRIEVKIEATSFFNMRERVIAILHKNVSWMKMLANVTYNMGSKGLKARRGMLINVAAA